MPFHRVTRERVRVEDVAPPAPREPVRTPAKVVQMLALEAVDGVEPFSERALRVVAQVREWHAQRRGGGLLLRLPSRLLVTNDIEFPNALFMASSKLHATTPAEVYVMRTTHARSVLPITYISDLGPHESARVRRHGL
jgi:hypothetical protein